MTRSKLAVSGTLSVTVSSLLAYPVHSVQAATHGWMANPDSWSWLPDVINRLLS